MKNYKFSPPSETIHKIRNLLNSLGIFVKESHASFSKNFHTVRVTIDTHNLGTLNIGTNGKGTTYQYCLASGYAELMERIQNYILFKGYAHATKYSIDQNKENSIYQNYLKENGLILDFLYDPKEKILPIEYILNENIEIYLKLFPFLNKDNMVEYFKNELNFDEVVCVPFYSAQEKTEIFLPLKLLFIACGSNGMASVMSI